MKRSILKILRKNLFNHTRIIGHEEFRKAAVLVLLYEKDGELLFLFQKRSMHVPQPGEVSFPGGRIEETDKDSCSAALRECEEELGIKKNNIEIIAPLGLLYSPLGTTVEAVIGIADYHAVQQMTINYDEVSYVFSVPFDWFVKNPPEEYAVILHAHSTYIDQKGKKIDLLPVDELGLPDTYKDTWGNGYPRVLVYKYNEEIIWGITARFVHEVVSAIQNS